METFNLTTKKIIFPKKIHTRVYNLKKLEIELNICIKANTDVQFLHLRFLHNL